MADRHRSDRLQVAAALVAAPIAGRGQAVRRGGAWPWMSLFAGMVACVASSGLGPLRAAAQEQAPNIILMMSDDYGWPYYSFMIDRLRAKLHGRNTATCNPAAWTSAQCEDDFDPGVAMTTAYGCADPPGAACQLMVQTPNLDSLAAGGVAFERGYVTDAACQPAWESLLTGLNRRDLVETTVGCPNGGPQTIPEALDKLDYNMLLAGKSWLQNPTSFFNDNVCEPKDTASDPTTCTAHDSAIRSTENDGIGETISLSLLKNFIKRQHAVGAPGEGHRPFFLIWSPLSPHYSYNHIPERIRGMYDVVETTNPPNITSNNFGNTSFHAYLEAITYYDERVGELVEFLQLLQDGQCDPNPEYDLSAALDAAYLNQPYDQPKCTGQPGNPTRYAGFRSRTLIVYLTDNPSGIQLSKAHFTENGLRTPLILNYPDRIPASGPTWPSSIDSTNVHGALVGAIDVFPTLLDFARGEIGPGRIFPDARSMRGIAENPSTYPSAWRRYFFTNSDAGSTGMMAVLDSVSANYTDGGARQGQFKVYTDGQVGTGYSSLKRVANVTVDPFESGDVFPAKPPEFITQTKNCLVKYANNTSTVRHLRGVLRAWDDCGRLPGDAAGVASCRGWLVDEKLTNEACWGTGASPPAGCSVTTTLCEDPPPDTTAFPPITCP